MISIRKFKLDRNRPKTRCPCLHEFAVAWKANCNIADTINLANIFQFNVVFRLIWRRDVVQHQINVETMLCTSTLTFTTFNNVETCVKTTLYISTLNWTTLDNVKTTLSFSTSIFTTLSKVETTLQVWPFGKKIKSWFKNKIKFSSFEEYDGLKIFIFPHLKRNL